LAALFIDQSKQADSIVERNLLDTERLALVQRIKDLKSLPNIDAALTKQLYEREQRLTEVDAKLPKLPAPQAPAVTHGLWKDLLRDGSGMSFHRFQIVVWTVILGTVFVRAVYQDLAMPDFNASLLGLMGLSAGTYIGFKIPEKSK
jgi:hypothetical protein